MTDIKALKVMPDFFSSCLWRLPEGSMIRYEEIKLPAEIVEDLEDWKKFYTEEAHDQDYRLKPEMVEELYARGLILAKRVKRARPDLEVWFWCDKADGPPFISKKLIS